MTEPRESEAPFKVIITRQIMYEATVMAPSAGDAGVILGDKLRANPPAQPPIPDVEIEDLGLTEMRTRQVGDWREAGP